jgi:hypothetical protein
MSTYDIVHPTVPTYDIVRLWKVQLFSVPGPRHGHRLNLSYRQLLIFDSQQAIQRGETRPLLRAPKQKKAIAAVYTLDLLTNKLCKIALEAITGPRRTDLGTTEYFPFAIQGTGEAGRMGVAREMAHTP